MTDDFKPVRYGFFNGSGEGLIEPMEQGLYVGYNDFLTAQYSRDHWKTRSLRWEHEAKCQEKENQHLEKLLVEAASREQELKGKLTKTQMSENEHRLVAMLADINAISFKAISK